MAYGRLPLKPNTYCSPWYRPWRPVVALASSTFWLSTRNSSLCQSGLQEGRCSACLSALSRWLSEHTEGLGNRAPARCFSSPSAIPLTLILWPLYHHPAAQGASFSYLQCLHCRDVRQLACFEWCPKTGATAVGRLSRRWVLGAGGTAPATSSPERSFPRHSIPTLEPTGIAIGTGSLYSWLEWSVLPQNSAGGIETRHQ